MTFVWAGVGARVAACGQCTRASQKRTSSMSFAEKHPYLFWQLIGWGILLIDFVFVVIAVFNAFGEWSYPIIVFPFIGALFAIIGSPCCLYATRATRVPQARSPEEDRAIRNKLTAVAMARKTPQAALLGALVVAAAVVLAGVTYVLGMRGHMLIGFAMMVVMVVVPFVILAKYQDAPDDLFLAIPEHQLDLSDGKREQFEKECRAVGAFWLPRAGE